MKMVPCALCPLRQHLVFKRNTAEEIAFIEGMRTAQVEFAAGDAIVHESTEEPPLYSLFRGWAFRYKTLSDGRRQILNFLLPGDLIGFQAHMAGEADHGVEALTNVVLCRYARPKIWELYKTHPELAFDVTWLTAHEEGIVDETLLSVGRRSALERIAMLMLHLYKRADALGLVEEKAIDLPLTQQHLADALGLSLVHTNKTLRKLHKLGLLRFERGHLEILGRGRLETLADYFERPLAQRPLL